MEYFNNKSAYLSVIASVELIIGLYLAWLWTVVAQTPFADIQNWQHIDFYPAGDCLCRYIIICLAIKILLMLFAHAICFLLRPTLRFVDLQELLQLLLLLGEREDNA